MTRKTPLQAPNKTPLGSGRVGKRRSASKRGLDLLAGLNPTEKAMVGLGRACFRKLARRAGVRRVSKECFDVRKGGIQLALLGFLKRVLRRAVILAEHGHRYTMIPNDVALALKQEGITMYKQGLDWNYGFFSLTWVRKRVEVQLSADELAQAAASLAQQQQREEGQAGGAAAGGEAGAEDEWAGGVAVEEDGGHERAGMEEEEEQQRVGEEQQQLTQQASVAAAGREQAGGVELADVGADAAVEPGGAHAVDAAAQQQQQQGVTAMPHAESAASAARAQCLSSPPGMRTPVVSEQRSNEIKAWMSELMHGQLHTMDRVSRSELKTVMRARHDCCGYEVDVVLRALDMKGAIMMEGEDDIYLCD